MIQDCIATLLKSQTGSHRAIGSSCDFHKLTAITQCSTNTPETGCLERTRYLSNGREHVHTHLTGCPSIIPCLRLVCPNLLFIWFPSILCEGKVELQDREEDLVVAEEVRVQERHPRPCFVEHCDQQCLLPVGSLKWEKRQYTTVYHSISQYTTVYHSIPQYIIKVSSVGWTKEMSKTEHVYM